MLSKGVLILRDNASVHKARVARAAIRDCRFEQLSHPPCSSDWVPKNYFSFRYSKKLLRGIKFETDEDLKSAVKAWFDGQKELLYFTGFKGLKEKWSQGIEFAGDILKKDFNFLFCLAFRKPLESFNLKRESASKFALESGGKIQSKDLFLFIYVLKSGQKAWRWETKKGSEKGPHDGKDHHT